MAVRGEQVRLCSGHPKVHFGTIVEGFWGGWLGGGGVCSVGPPGSPTVCMCPKNAHLRWYVDWTRIYGCFISYVSLSTNLKLVGLTLTLHYTSEGLWSRQESWQSELSLHNGLAAWFKHSCASIGPCAHALQSGVCLPYGQGRPSLSLSLFPCVPPSNHRELRAVYPEVCFGQAYRLNSQMLMSTSNAEDRSAIASRFPRSAHASDLNCYSSGYRARQTYGTTATILGLVCPVSIGLNCLWMR